jgi:hypothetical protein
LSTPVLDSLCLQEFSQLILLPMPLAAHCLLLLERGRHRRRHRRRHPWHCLVTPNLLLLLLLEA